MGDMGDTTAGARDRRAALGRWSVAVTGAAIVAGPPALTAVAGWDPARLVDFDWPPASLVYIGCVVIAATMLLDLPAPWPSMQHSATVIRWLLVVGGWAGLVALMFFLGADAPQGWLPDMVGREPGGQPDMDSAVWTLLWSAAVVTVSLMILLGAFLAALVTGRQGPVQARAAGTALARGPLDDGGQGADLR